jgi:iron-sulfur cluster assembly accessory protein
MENVIHAPVSLTSSTIEELRRLMAEEGFDNSQVLRIGVKGGGCSGLSYILAFDQAQPGDDHFEIEGISCVMNPAHGLYLLGMEINWSTGLDARGFVFTNPNASNTCGCGSSFSV